MNPRQLKTFLAVARHGNFTRAASEANLAQSSLSDQMQALEEELGAPLFERSRQGVTLTPAGDVLRSYAEEILARRLPVAFSRDASRYRSDAEDRRQR